MVKTILELLASGQDAWLVSRMEDGKITAMGTFDEVHGLRFAELDEAMLRPWLTSSAVYRKGEPSYYVEPTAGSRGLYLRRRSRRKGACAGVGECRVPRGGV